MKNEKQQTITNNHTILPFSITVSIKSLP